MSSVFISYSHGDKKKVAWLRQALLKAGIKVWWDEDIPPGGDWEWEIRRTLNNCSVFLLCLSDNWVYQETSGVYPEVRDAIAMYRKYAPGSIFLIPVRLTPCEIPFIEIDSTKTLKNIQYLDLFPESRIPENISKLIKTIRTKFPKKNDSPPNYNNPFGNKGCITDPEKFFDRQELFRRIFEELKKGSSISLVGDSKIGKSSILAMLPYWGPQELGLSEDQFLHVDMQCINNEDDFFEKLKDELKFPQPLRGYKLRRQLANKRYILCIDEIERMTNKHHFTGNERTELRGLADGANTPLTLVIASRSPLEYLFEDDPLRTSPLAGLCGPPLRVQPFDETTTREFLTQRLQHDVVEFTQEQMHQLYLQTRGNPGELQAAAAELYRNLSH